MSAKELFGVCVRLIGLLLVLHAVGSLVFFLFAMPATPSLERSALIKPMLTYIFETLAGMFLFLKASLVELLAYPERTD